MDAMTCYGVAIVCLCIAGVVDPVARLLAGARSRVDWLANVGTRWRTLLHDGNYADHIRSLVDARQQSRTAMEPALVVPTKSRIALPGAWLPSEVSTGSRAAGTASLETWSPGAPGPTPLRQGATTELINRSTHSGATHVNCKDAPVATRLPFSQEGLPRAHDSELAHEPDVDDRGPGKSDPERAQAPAARHQQREARQTEHDPVEVIVRQLAEASWDRLATAFGIALDRRLTKTEHRWDSAPSVQETDFHVCVFNHGRRALVLAHAQDYDRDTGATAHWFAFAPWIGPNGSAAAPLAPFGTGRQLPSAMAGLVDFDPPDNEGAIHRLVSVGVYRVPNDVAIQIAPLPGDGNALPIAILARVSTPVQRCVVRIEP